MKITKITPCGNNIQTIVVEWDFTPNSGRVLALRKWIEEIAFQRQPAIPSCLSRFFKLFSDPLPSFHLLSPHPAQIILLFSPFPPPLLYIRRCHSHFAHLSSDSIYFFRHYSFSDFCPALCLVCFALPGHVVEIVAKQRSSHIRFLSTHRFQLELTSPRLLVRNG